MMREIKSPPRPEIGITLGKICKDLIKRAAGVRDRELAFFLGQVDGLRPLGFPSRT